MAKYFVLLSRNDINSPYDIAFGSYDVDAVYAERNDMRDEGYKASQLRVISCGDTQAEIEAELERVNAAYIMPKPTGIFSRAF